MISSEILLIAAAAKEELDWLAGQFNELQERSLGPHRVTIVNHGNEKVGLLVAGAGAINTAGALGAIVPAMRPRGVVFCGCGGAFPGWGLVKGAVVFATEEIAPQLGIEPDRKGHPVKALPFLPNRTQLDDDLARRGLEALVGSDLFSGVSVRSGPFMTVSTVTASPSTGEGYRHLYGAVVENMEGFAAARMSQRYTIPSLEVRSVSNMVGTRDRSIWNLDLAFKRAQQAVLTLLEKGIMP